MLDEKSLKDSKREELFDQLCSLIEGGNSQSKGHIIIKEKFETDEAAKRRYLSETGESIRENDLEIIVTFVAPSKGDREDSAPMEIERTTT